MTPAVLDRPASRLPERAAAGAPAEAPERLGGGRVTLEERLNAALHEARANGSTDCPVCQGRMTFTGTGPGHGAACGGCGSELA